MTGIELKHVPCGASSWQNDLVAGQIDASTWPLITLIEHLQSGKSRAIAISNGGKASEQAPGVPSFADVGLPDFDMTVWAGLLAPAGTPKGIVDKLGAAAAKAAQGKAYRAFTAKSGATAVGSTPAEFAARPPPSAHAGRKSSPTAASRWSDRPARAAMVATSQAEKQRPTLTAALRRERTNSAPRLSCRTKEPAYKSCRRWRTAVRPFAVGERGRYWGNCVSNIERASGLWFKAKA